MPFGRRSPLEALALPGVILAYKYSQFRQRRREAASRRVTERELTALHHKIDKLLSKLEESEPEPPTSQEDECVICINARATMQTSPCGHRVVCRRCFVKTIQSAVAQRLLPLRCVICRARVNRLTTGSGSWRLQSSASSYSMGSKSWGGVPGSASSYSVGARVAQSTSLYSMSSGSSCLSGVSNASRCSATSTTSGMSSTSSSTSSSAASCSNSSHRSSNSSITDPNRLRSRLSNGTTTISGNSASSSATVSETLLHRHHHGGGGCAAGGCLGAIPRNPLLLRKHGQYPMKLSRLPDMPNRLPPIIEFRSPARLPTPSPVHTINPKFRYSSYTQKGNSHEMSPLLLDEQQQQLTDTPLSLTTALDELGMEIGIGMGLGGGCDINGLDSLLSTTSSASSTISTTVIFSSSTKTTTNVTTTENKSSLLTSSTTSPLPTAASIKIGMGAKVAPMNVKSPINKLNMATGKPAINPTAMPSTSTRTISFGAAVGHHHYNKDEKIDNKKNENMEKKKKEEKLKLKAEKEARKEEKRLAKEEEKLAKLLAKEEKKRGKKEAKEALLAGECVRK